MVEEPQGINNLFKKDYHISNAFMDTDELHSQKPIVPVSEKSSATRRLTNRQSFSRGTASSMAKVARPEKAAVDAAALAKRRLVAKPRKASLTPSVIDNNRMLLMGSTSPTQMHTQRRSSWSPFSQQPSNAPSSVTHNENKLPSSPSPLPSPSKTRSSKPIVSRKLATPPPHDRFIVNASSNNKDSSESNNNIVTASATDDSTAFKKRPTSQLVLTDAASAVEEAAPEIPLETPASLAPDVAADEVINIRSAPSQSSSIETHTHHHHHHHHHSSGEDDHLPGYMRRPICAACNRNVKVTSSSESTSAHHHKSLSTTTNTSKNSSRRSSFSKRSSSGDLHAKYANTRRALVAKMKHSKSEGDEDSETKNTTAALIITPTSTLSLKSTSSSAPEEEEQPQPQEPQPESEPEQQQQQQQQYPGTHPHHRVSLRSNSPTSPIPTRRKKKLFTKKEGPVATAALSSSSSSSSSSSLSIKESQQTSNSLVQVQSMDKWNQLLAQQQLLLTILLPNQDGDEEFNMIQSNISKLGTTLHQGEYETILLETQAKILQKLTLLMMQRQQQRDALLCLSSPTITTMAMPLTIENQPYEQEEPILTMPSWQTKLEYGIARFKWNMSQWIGNVVGTGDIQEQDFDSLGYPKNVVITGICVTTEPGLLPKSLQKYYKPGHDTEVICHKYMIQLTRDLRMTQFQLVSQEAWKQDHQVDRCEFTFKHEGKTKTCQAEFGLFQRRHHCRSCGHVFCQTHSSNRLPLFISSGQERGEWSRVCDSCFYARVENQFLARS